MRAGRYRHRITIRRRASATDRSWVAVATDVPADAEPLRGREFVAVQAAQSRIEIKFTIRYRPDVTADMQVLWDGKAFELVGPPIDVKGRHRDLELMCQGDPDA